MYICGFYADYDLPTAKKFSEVALDKNNLQGWNGYNCWSSLLSVKSVFITESLKKARNWADERHERSVLIQFLPCNKQFSEEKMNWEFRCRKLRVAGFGFYFDKVDYICEDYSGDYKELEELEEYKEEF